MSMVVRNGHLHSWFCALAAICFLAVHTWAADSTTCASSRLDWYTSVVGETPCTTYQRLRRICNNDYNVPALKTNTPGDTCNDQVSACCCNMIAFQLSMLCLNCQQDVLTGSGYDAPPGTYTTYLGTCGAGTGHSLPSDIQSSVCNEGIRLDDFLYGGWADGSWFYVWMSENAERTHAANNNQTFTHCAQPKSPTSMSIRTSTSTQTLPGASTEVKLNAPLGTTSDSNPAPTSITTPASPSTSSTMIPAGPLSLPPETPTQPSIQSSPSGLPDALQDVSAGPNTQTDTSSLVATFALASSSAQGAPTVSPGNGASSSASSHLPVIIGSAIAGLAVIAGATVGLLVRRRCRARRGGTRAREHSGPNPYDSVSRGSSIFDTSPSMAVTRSGYGYERTDTDIWHDSTLQGPMSSSLRSAWSEHPGAPVQSDVTASGQEGLRHTDAGVLIPLARSGSGRLPPAYRSWEEGSTIMSEGSEPVPTSVEYAHSGTMPDPHLPLAPLRLEEKQ